MRWPAEAEVTYPVPSRRLGCAHPCLQNGMGRTKDEEGTRTHQSRRPPLWPLLLQVSVQGYRRALSSGSTSMALRGNVQIGPG